MGVGVDGGSGSICGVRDWSVEGGDWGLGFWADVRAVSSGGGGDGW